MENQETASRTKRAKITSQAPTESNGYILSVSAEILGTNETITYSEQTSVVSEFWARVLVAGIKERFATIIASANGNNAAIVERLHREVAALKAGIYASRGNKGSGKLDFINTVIAMAFVKRFGVSKVNEDTFNDIMNDVELLQEVNASYEALAKEDKLAAVKEFAKVAAGISYFRNAA